MRRFAHQEAEYRDHRYSEARALLWQMRTGKTRAVVESACALADALEIDGCLVIAPNGIHAQWAEEQVSRWRCGWRRHSTFAWQFSDPRNLDDFEDLIAGPHDFRWLCVNMEVVLRDDVQRAMARFRRTVGRAMFVVDESHHFARAGTKRTAVARGLGRRYEYRRILTGTSVENSHRQAFTQFEILRRDALGHHTVKEFDREFTEFGLEYRGGNRVVVPVGPKNLPELKRRMAALSSVVLRRDCADLPPVQRDRRVAVMTEHQRRYWDVVKNKELEAAERLGHDRVFAGGAALVKLQQIEGGYFFNPAKRALEEIVKPAENPKMLILLDEVDQYDGQVIVWFEYVHELEAAYAALGGENAAGRYHGRIGQARRDETLKSFKVGKIKVLLAQPAAGGEGRDMSAAGKIVWFSHTPNAVIRAQADERATAMGGDSVQVIDIIAPVGEYFVGITDRKRTLADDLSREGLRAVLDRMRR